MGGERLTFIIYYWCLGYPPSLKRLLELRLVIVPCFSPRPSAFLSLMLLKRWDEANWDLRVVFLMMFLHPCHTEVLSERKTSLPEILRKFKRSHDQTNANNVKIFLPGNSSPANGESDPPLTGFLFILFSQQNGALIPVWPLIKWRWIDYFASAELKRKQLNLSVTAKQFQNCHPSQRTPPDYRSRWII